MINYAKAHGCLQGNLEMMADTLEIKIDAKYLGTVSVPKEVKEELKEMIAKMIKDSEEVGHEPSEFMNVPKEIKKFDIDCDKEFKDGILVDRGFYLEYDASDPTCNLPVPDYDSRDCL